jgi:hypothetical protein
MRVAHTASRLGTKRLGGTMTAQGAWQATTTNAPKRQAWSENPKQPPGTPLATYRRLLIAAQGNNTAAVMHR